MPFAVARLSHRPAIALAGQLSSLAEGVNMNKPLRTDRRVRVAAALIDR